MDIGLIQQRQNSNILDMREYINFLIKGTEFNFAQIPADDKTAILLTELKAHGFISNDTQIEHFRVIFGIPLHKSKTPFEPIKWKKNEQLLRYFIYTLFHKKHFGELVCLQSLNCLQTNTEKLY